MIDEVALLGLGSMGQPMALNLVKAGLRVVVWNRTRAKCDSLRAAGAEVATSPAEAASRAEIVVTMLWDGKAVDEVLFGKRGVAEGVGIGSVVIDMSTTTPEHAIRCAERLRVLGVSFLDAPVTGARSRAEDGTLVVMVGGEEDTLARVRHVLTPLSSRVELVGQHGAGQLVKLANNVAGFITIAGVCEGLGLVAAGGGDVRKAVGVLDEGTARSAALTAYGALIVEDTRDSPVTIGVARKDLVAAVETAQGYGANLDISESLGRIYEELLNDGQGSLGCHLLYWRLLNR